MQKARGPSACVLPKDASEEGGAWARVSCLNGALYVAGPGALRTQLSPARPVP